MIEVKEGITQLLEETYGDTNKGKEINKTAQDLKREGEPTKETQTEETWE